MSLISHQIDELRATQRVLRDHGYDTAVKQIGEAIDTIEHQKAIIVAQNFSNGWIPVEESCPDSDRAVLITYYFIGDNRERMTIARYKDCYFKPGTKDWFSAVNDHLWHGVAAWRELPEPYRDPRLGG